MRPPSATDSLSETASSDLVEATPRGLAVGVMAHLDGVEVSRLAGSSDDGYVSVMVDTDDPEAASIYLVVQVSPDVGAIRCAEDSGYTTKLCETSGPSTTELALRGNDNDELPLAIGRVFDTSRKFVLVEVFGSSEEKSELLARELLGDPLLGALTSEARNEEGEQLDDFESLDLQVSVGPA